MCYLYRRTLPQHPQNAHTKKHTKKHAHAWTQGRTHLRKRRRYTREHARKIMHEAPLQHTLNTTANTKHARNHGHTALYKAHPPKSTEARRKARSPRIFFSPSEGSPQYTAQKTDSKKTCTLNPFSTAVPLWGQSRSNYKYFAPKNGPEEDCIPTRVIIQPDALTVGLQRKTLRTTKRHWVPACTIPGSSYDPVNQKRSRLNVATTSA